jgi:hypothetical protein
VGLVVKTIRRKTMEIIVQIIYGLVALVFYFLPTIIGHYQDHYSFRNLFLVNLLLGWTGIGWIVAFIWALVPDIFKNRI